MRLRFKELPGDEGYLAIVDRLGALTPEERGLLVDARGVVATQTGARGVLFSDIDIEIEGENS